MSDHNERYYDEKFYSVKNFLSLREIEEFYGKTYGQTCDCGVCVWVGCSNRWPEKLGRDCFTSKAEAAREALRLLVKERESFMAMVNRIDDDISLFQDELNSAQGSAGTDQEE